MAFTFLGYQGSVMFQAGPLTTGILEGTSILRTVLHAHVRSTVRIQHSHILRVTRLIARNPECMVPHVFSGRNGHRAEDGKA